MLVSDSEILLTGCVHSSDFDKLGLKIEAQGNATCGFFPLNPFFPSVRTWFRRNRTSPRGRSVFLNAVVYPAAPGARPFAKFEMKRENRCGCRTAAPLAGAASLRRPACGPSFLEARGRVGNPCVENRHSEEHVGRHAEEFRQLADMPRPMESLHHVGRSACAKSPPRTM